MHFSGQHLVGERAKKNAHFLSFFQKGKGAERGKRGGNQKCIFLGNIELKSALKKCSFFSKGGERGKGSL